MADSVLYCGAFDLSRYGSLAIDWTDASGVHSGIVTMSTGTYVHGSVAGTVGVSGISDFVAALAALMDAATAQTVSGSFDNATGLVTLACTGGTFTLSFPGAAGARMQALLGFYGAITGLTTYTGSHHPKYVLKPYLQCVSGKPRPAKEKGRTVDRMTSDGSMYRLAPSSIGDLSTWMHQFEPKGMADRTWFDAVSSSLTAKNLYTWEDLWDDYGDHRLPIFSIWYTDSSGGVTEYRGFDLTTSVYDESTHANQIDRDDTRWKITIAARLRGRAIA